MKKLALFAAAFVVVAVFSTAARADQRFVANLSSAQEVPAVASAGRGVCTVVLNQTETQITTSCTYSGLTSNVVGAHIHSPAVPGANANILIDFAFTGAASGTFNRTSAVTPVQIRNLRTNRFYINIHTANFPNGEVRGQVKAYLRTFFDIDGDSRSDINVYRPSNNTFYHLRSVDGALQSFRFGAPGDFTLTADFDGDGLDDYVAARVNFLNGNITWYILQSSNGVLRSQPWGNLLFEDFPAVGDYDNDGKLDIAVFRESTGVWYILQSSNGAVRAGAFGTSGDTPVPGDYDRDGRTDFAVARPENNALVWYVRYSSTGQVTRTVFGAATDTVVPQVPIDVDGDSAQDILVYREADGARTWYALLSSDNSLFAATWGLTTDTPLLADYDGDGRTDLVARRDESGTLVWYILNSANGQLRRVPFGTTGDQ